MKLFLTGFTQVLLVAFNTIMLAKSNYIGTLLAAFLIGIVWTGNVKRISSGFAKDRVIYSIGSALGSITALFIYNNLT